MKKRGRESINQGSRSRIDVDDDAGEVVHEPMRSTSSDSIDIHIKDSLNGYLWFSRRVATRNTIQPADRSMTYSWGRLYTRVVDDDSVAESCCINRRHDLENAFTMVLDGTCGGNLALTQFKKQQKFRWVVSFTPQRSLAKIMQAMMTHGTESPSSSFLALGVFYELVTIKVQHHEQRAWKITCVRQGSCLRHVGIEVGDFLLSIDGVDVEEYDMGRVVQESDPMVIRYIHHKQPEKVRTFASGKGCVYEELYQDSIMRSNNEDPLFVAKVVSAYVDLLSVDERLKPSKTRIPARCANPNECRAYLVEDELPEANARSSYISNLRKFRECRLLQYGNEHEVLYETKELYPELANLDSRFFQKNDNPVSRHDLYGIHRGLKKREAVVEAQRRDQILSLQRKGRNDRMAPEEDNNPTSWKRFKHLDEDDD